MRAAIVIPARYDSKRLPGKPLMKDGHGKAMIQYVWEAAGRVSSVNRVIVATDDERIRKAVLAFGGEVRMTSAGHRCGSDRVAEVAADLDHDVVVNLQGDEPAIPPEAITQTVNLLAEDAECVIGTLAVKIESEEELADPNAVKVVVDNAWRALYFSRSPIPHVRDTATPLADSPTPHLLHVGIYAYRREFLLRFASLPPHPLEQAERLEQLRALAHGYRIKVALTPHRPMKVDTPEDFRVFCDFTSRTGS